MTNAPDPDRADRWRWKTGDVTLRRAPGKPPLRAPSPMAALADVRVRRGLSQAAIAERMGRGQEAVSRLEHRQDVRLSSLVEYARALGARDISLVLDGTSDQPVAISLTPGTEATREDETDDA